MRNPERILLVRLSHLGDVVHALGLFHALRAAHPAAEIAWAIQPEFEGLIAGLPGLGRRLRFERGGGLAAWWALRRACADFRPDWAVDAQGNAKSGLVSRLSGAPRRVASHRDDWQEPWAAWTANDRAPAGAPGERHAMQRMERLARHLVPETPLPLRLDADLSETEHSRAEQSLRERLPRAGEAPVLLHLSTPGDVRGWPLARWAELARGLRERGRGVLVLSGPAEEALGAELARSLAPDPGLVHWIGQRGLRELAALFAAAGRRGLRLVCCDSGPMHLAAAHGLAVTALEGPQDAARTGPWPHPELATGHGPRHALVRSSRELDCAPCLRRRCARAEGPVCMEGISAEDVLATLEGEQ